MSYRVPSKDYGKQNAELWPELSVEIERVFREENPVLGESVAAFEREFASHLGVQHVVGVGTGTDALVLSLRAVGVLPGDEVITAANTFAATITAIALVGARPVLVDPDPRTLTIDAAGVEQAMGEAIKVVIPVHLYGRLCDMEPLMELCNDRGVAIVEDAAQAHGANGVRQAGAFGKAGCFSFHPSKNLGAFGDGGAIATDDVTIAKTLRELRNLGKRTKYEFAHVSPNTKLDTLQAAVLRVKLRHLDRWNARRREIAGQYTASLNTVLETPVEAAHGQHVFHLYAAHLDRRDELRRYLKESGINAGVHYPTPPHLQPWHTGMGYRPGDFPVAEASAARELSLPVSPELSDEQVAFVCERIHAFFAS